MLIPFRHYIMKEITMKCALAYNDKDFKETVDAFIAGQYATTFLSKLIGFAGKFKGVESMITSRISLHDVVKQGFDELVHCKDKHIKIMVTPNVTKI
jgi:threonine dehydrogenase-like Zn-dependent dehydrogenase